MNFRYLTVFTFLGVLIAGLWFHSQNQHTPQGIHKLDVAPFDAVYIVNDDDFFDYQVDLIYRSGEAHNDSLDGLPHYIEHLAADRVAKSTSAQQNRHSNAWTSGTGTGYWQSATINQLRDTIQALVNTAMPLDSDPEFAKTEIDIVLREYDERLGGDPLHLHRNAGMAVLLQDAALARPVIGTKSSIEQFSLEAAQALHAKTHDLSNAVLIIRGALDETSITQLLQNLDYPPSPASKFHRDISIPALMPIRDVAQIDVDKLDQRILHFDWLYQVDVCDSALDCEARNLIAAKVLFSTRAGGLTTPLQYDEFVANGFEGYQYLMWDTAFAVTIYASPEPDVSLDTLADRIETHLRATAENGLPKASFDAAKADALADYTPVPFDTDDEVARLTTAISYANDYRSISALHTQLENTTLDDVNAYLRSMLGSSRIVIRKYMPAE